MATPQWLLDLIGVDYFGHVTVVSVHVPAELARRQAEEADTAKAVAKGCDLRLMSSVNDVSGIPTEGKSLIIVAVVNEVLHFRIFDGDGKMVVDTDEKRLTDRPRPIEDLRKQLESLWPPHELTESEKVRVIAAVTSIGGLTTYPEIARQHSDEVEELDSLLHSGGEFNGKTTFVLFTDDYYRDPEKYRRRWQAKRDWHTRMAAVRPFRSSAMCSYQPYCLTDSGSRRLVLRTDVFHSQARADFPIGVTTPTRGTALADLGLSSFLVPISFPSLLPGGSADECYDRVVFVSGRAVSVCANAGASGH